MEEALHSQMAIDQELKAHIDKFLPKDGFLKPNKAGFLKMHPVRGYFRANKNDRYNQLLSKKYQLQKRMNGLFFNEIKLELEQIECEIAKLEYEHNHEVA